jgi:hypothetical protein
MLTLFCLTVGAVVAYLILEYIIRFIPRPLGSMIMVVVILAAVIWLLGFLGLVILK